MFKYFVFLLFTCISHSLFALTTLEVSLSTDNNPGGIGESISGQNDLRYCLNVMNQALNATPDDYAIGFAFPMTIQLNGILPIINNSPNPVNITIGNPGSIPTVTIDGNNAYSGFFIPIGNVTIQNMIFQNLKAKGGNGGNGTSGGGGGMGAGAAIYAPRFFLNRSNPSIILSNVSINNCAAIGGNGGSYVATYSVPSTGNEGGGGGGGFSGNGGSITISGSTGGAGGGGFGGNGGDVTLSTDDPFGGGGGGGGGIGSLATIGTLTNLSNGGNDVDDGQDGSGYGLTISAGSGGGGHVGGSQAGGGGGGGSTGGLSGGGGGGSFSGANGLQPEGFIPPGGAISPSGGSGQDGGGGGGGGVVTASIVNGVDGQPGSGGYGGGGGGGAGTGAYAPDYSVIGGSGGVGGGGGGGGANQSGITPSEGGNSQGGGGGGGGGPSNGSNAAGGTDIGNLGGGSGGVGANNLGSGFGGGGGGGGSALGAAIFVDSDLNFTLQAIPGIPTNFNTSNNFTQAGNPGSGYGGSDGTPGSALGNSIFLRARSSLTLSAQDTGDLLTLGEQVAFDDDTNFGGEGTAVFVKGNGTVVYNGITDYQGTVLINNANFKVNGVINTATIFVCRNIYFSSQRGQLSGSGVLAGNVFVNSGAISPNTGETLTLGSLSLSSADPNSDALGSLVHIEIDSSSTPSVVVMNGPTSLAGILEIHLDSNVQPGQYTILTSSGGITGTFDFVKFTGATPNYQLSYLPLINPTFVRFDFLGYPSPPPHPPTPPSPPPPPPPPPISVLLPPTHLRGKEIRKRYCKKIKTINVLKWDPPASGPRPVAYRICRTHLKNIVGVVRANQKLTFKDNVHKKKKSYTYYIICINANQISYPAKIKIKSKYKRNDACSFSENE